MANGKAGTAGRRIESLTTIEAQQYLESGIPWSPAVQAALVGKMTGYEMPDQTEYAPQYQPFLYPALQDALGGAMIPHDLNIMLDDPNPEQ
jgi:hypothetical protein